MKKINPQAVLITTGLMMLVVSLVMGNDSPILNNPTGSIVFDLFRLIREVLDVNLTRVGLMIMTIGGYVAYMKKIKASDALVFVSMRPLSVFRKYPYILATLVIPIGQLLFICTPSAAGLGLLLVASIYPVLLGLGISPLSALSVIAFCTIYDMGPGSANTARAAELVGLDNMGYFVEHQLALAIPVTVVLMISSYFTNRYFDRKTRQKSALSMPVTATDSAIAAVADEPVSNVMDVQTAVTPDLKLEVPVIYAVLPVLPLILLVVFSRYLNLCTPPIELDTTTAMWVSLFIAMFFEYLRTRNLSAVFNSLRFFWNGMGDVFSSVVTLIVSAEIFSKGLLRLGFIDALVEGSTHMGLSGTGIAVLITVIIFAAAMLMGSGNASFFSFGPLVPSIAAKVGMEGVRMILPMQLAASMGRALSPIAGVIIAIAEIAGVSPMDLAKRNAIPLISALLFMIIYHFFFSAFII